MRRIIYGAIILFLLIGIVAYSQWQWGDKRGGDTRWTVRGGDSQLAKQPLIRYGCGACHVINGTTRANGRVGPKLEDIRDQIYLGGIVPNTSENMVHWIMFPQSFSPGTAMPDLDVMEQDARNIAAYLFENR